MEKGKFKRIGLGLCGLMLASAVSLSGCGGGGGGGTTGGTTGGTGSALQMAEKISVVDAQSSGGGATPLRIGKFKLAPPNAGTTSDWGKDVTQVYVAERSTESFNTINEILCMIGQSQYDDMVNKGTYKAQIDKTQCSSDQDSAESAGQDSQNQSSGSDMPEYEIWTVDSSRADNNDGTPHIVKVWINEDARQDGDHQEPAKVIYVKTTITEGVSATNPYGIFTLNFRGHPKINGVVNTNMTMFKGYLKSERDGSGKVLLKFAMEGGFTGQGGYDTFNEKVVLDRAGDGSTGGGTLKVFNSYSGGFGSGSNSAYFNIAFNTSNFRRAEAPNNSNEVCLKRPKSNDPTTFKASAWSYGLYDASGARLNRNSGFPIKYNDGTKDYHGWVGYWGLWVPDGVTINNGDTVYKMTYGQGGGTSTPYTVFKAGGKLKKHTRNLIALNDIKNLPLDWWECSGQSCTGYRVMWDSNSNQFIKFAVQNQQTYMWDESFVDTPLDLNTLNYGELNFYSQSLGGQVRVKLTANGTPPSPITYSYPSPTANAVVFYKEDIVYPGDTNSPPPTALRCYDNCPQYVSATEVSGSGWGGGQNSTAYDYSFDATAMVLKDTGNNPLLMTVTSNQFQWGFMSGAMFDPATPNLNTLLACDWDANQVCGWKAWSELPEFYTWETGKDNWNQLTLLKDSNGVVKFEAPLQVEYTHSEVGSKYDGTKFYLEYAGFGDLHGIPGTCVSMDTGEPANCGPNTRWLPEFTIAEGATVLNNGSGTYYVKPLQMELSMKQDATAGACSSLALTTYTLPDIALWEDPNIGAEPAVTGAPAVIGGVLQSLQ